MSKYLDQDAKALILSEGTQLPYQQLRNHFIAVCEHLLDPFNPTSGDPAYLCSELQFLYAAGRRAQFFVKMEKDFYCQKYLIRIHGFLNGKNQTCSEWREFIGPHIVRRQAKHGAGLSQ